MRALPCDVLVLDHNLLEWCLSRQITLADPCVELFRVHLVKTDNDSRTGISELLIIGPLIHRVSKLLKSLLVERWLVAQHDRKLLQKHLQNAVQSDQLVLFVVSLRLVASFDQLKYFFCDNK